MPRAVRGSGTADNACNSPPCSSSVTARGVVLVGVVTADSTEIGHADIAGEVLKVSGSVENSMITYRASPASIEATHPTKPQLKAPTTENATALSGARCHAGAMHSPCTAAGAGRPAVTTPRPQLRTATTTGG